MRRDELVPEVAPGSPRVGRFDVVTDTTVEVEDLPLPVEEVEQLAGFAQTERGWEAHDHLTANDSCAPTIPPVSRYGLGMRPRILGKTGLRVSELGFGAWGIGGTGWIGAEDDESLRALRGAIVLGVNFIEAIATDLEVLVEQMPELALRFCVSHPAVSTAIAGMRTVAHVEANVGAVDARPLPGDQLARLRGHRWVRDFYRAPAGV